MIVEVSRDRVIEALKIAQEILLLFVVSGAVAVKGRLAAGRNGRRVIRRMPLQGRLILVDVQRVAEIFRAAQSTSSSAS